MTSVDAIPLVALLLSLASSALFFLVGRTVHRRPVSPDAHAAKVSFVTFWYGLAGVSVVGAAMSLPGFPLDLDLFLVLTIVLMLGICVALAGLVQYLVFLYTSKTILPGLAVAYGAIFLMLLAFIWRSRPTGVVASRWGPEMQFATPVESGPLYWAVVLLVLVPPVLSAGAYLSLYRMAKDRILKRRILLVSLSIIVWFGSSLLGSIGGDTESDSWRVVSRLIGLSAAATILYAYAGLKPDGPDTTMPTPREEAGSIYEPPKRGASSVGPAA